MEGGEVIMELNVMNSVKVLCGISKQDYSFDEELLMHTNAVIFGLSQIVDSDVVKPINITTKTMWCDILEDSDFADNVRSYIGMKVKSMFDPPASSVVVEALNKHINEMEWRIANYKTNKEVINNE